ncbi:MAG: DeoR/GlpR family DNA-binding transcription regulator [Marmoricola sp.]
MYAEERQQAIAALVQRGGRVAVADLAREYAVTTETVRRDLDTLERAGLLQLFQGGAVAAGVLDELVLTERDTSNVGAKEAIARAAVALLGEEVRTVFLDAGSTTARVAALLGRDRPLTVFTHAVPVAAHLAGRPHIALHLLPGRVRRTTHAAVGAETVAALGRLRVDLVLLGTNGLTAADGASTPDPEEAAVKRAIVAAGRRRVVLADATKLGRRDLVSFAEPDEVDVLVTDASADSPAATELAQLAGAGVTVVTA